MRNRPLPAPEPVPPVKRAQVDKFLKGLQDFRAKSIDQGAQLDEDEVKKYDQAGVKAFLDSMTAGSQQAIARRMMMDIMKSPTKKSSDRPKRKSKKKTSPKAKSKRTSKKKAPKRSKAKKKKASRRR